MNIDGVKLFTVTKRCDDRGFFAEIFKANSEWMESPKQFSMTKTNAGVIKAFHKHKEQTDIWFVSSGMARVVLHENENFGVRTDVLYLGEDNCQILLIPKTIWHGYQVIGDKPVILFYITDKVYDRTNPDEWRLSPKHFGDDWSIVNR